MRLLQAAPSAPHAAIDTARDLGCGAIVWDLREPSGAAVEAARRAGLASEGWLQVARDEAAAAAHPDWMHCPQHHEWLTRYPDFAGRHPALVAPYLGLNTRLPFDHALETAAGLLLAAPDLPRIWLADIQGPPMGCGCGNPCCRSWDNAPGEKVAPSAYDRPEILFPLEFFGTLRTRLDGLGVMHDLVPVLCPECERGISLDGVSDPDGPDGTDLCQGITCMRPCALDYWPRLLAAFREAIPEIGLLLTTAALDKDHPAFGPPRAWASRAHRTYGTDLIPCIEPEDAGAFDACLILTAAPQTCWPVEPPAGYEPSVPAIMCGYCPPAA